MMLQVPLVVQPKSNPAIFTPAYWTLPLALETKVEDGELVFAIKVVPTGKVVDAGTLGQLLKIERMPLPYIGHKPIVEKIQTRGARLGRRRTRAS